MEINKFFKKDTVILASLAMIAFLLRLPFISSWLEDWDAVQFALGMHDFNIVNHQPHPPGYPLYILLGKFFFLIFQNDIQALTFLSLLAGSLAVIPLYILVRKMFSQIVAILASVLFIFAPVEWILSETPVSNISGLFFLLCLGYLIYFLADNRKKFFLIGGIAGLILGVRFTDFPIVFSLLGLVSLRGFRKYGLKYPLFLILAFFIGLSLWLIPTIFIIGWQKFILANQVVSQYVIRHDVLLGKSLSLVDLFWTRFQMLKEVLKAGYTPYFLIICMLATAKVVSNIKVLKDFRYQILLTWILSYGFALAFYFNLELPQYTLPLLLPLVVFAALMFDEIRNGKYRFFFLPFFIITCGVLVNTSLNQVYKQSQGLPPTIAPVMFIKEHFSPQETTLLTTFTYRQFQYYAPEFKNYYVTKDTLQNIQTKYVIIDYEGLKNQLPALMDYQIIDKKVYARPEVSFPRLHQTEIFILKKND